MTTDKPLILIVEDSHAYSELLYQAKERGRNRIASDIEGPGGQAVYSARDDGANGPRRRTPPPYRGLTVMRSRHEVSP